MNCSYYRHLIIKRESGMLRERQINELENHLVDCNECQVYLEQQKSVQNILDEFKKRNTELKNPEELTSRIMNRINQQENISIFSSLLNFIDKILFMLDRKIIKYSLVLTSVFLVIVFVNQQKMLNHEIRGINRYMKQVKLNKENDNFYRNNRYKILAKQMDKSSNDDIIEEIRINREDFNKLLEEYNHLVEENEVLKKMIEDHIGNMNLFNKKSNSSIKKNL